MSRTPNPVNATYWKRRSDHFQKSLEVIRSNARAQLLALDAVNADPSEDAYRNARWIYTEATAALEGA